MKRTLSMFLSILLVLSIFSGMAIPTFAAEADVKVNKISGALTAPGESEVYLITDKDGNKIENFSAKYTIEADLKLPLSLSGPKSTADGTTFEIKVLDTCSTEAIKLEGTVKVVSIEDKTKSTVVFKADGKQTVKNSVTKVSGDVSITTSSGSRLYDFSGTTGNINVYFGEDAAIEMHGGETGSKCLAYNIDPNQNLKTKYSLTGSNSAFINFVGAPKFDHTVTVKLAVPVNSTNPKVYQLKDGSTNELEEIAVKVGASGNDELIYFETNKLAATYVITDEAIEGIEMAAPIVPNKPVDSTEKEETPVTENKPVVDDTEKSPQTGSSIPMYVACICALTGALAVMFVTKKKY